MSWPAVVLRWARSGPPAHRCELSGPGIPRRCLSLQINRDVFLSRGVNAGETVMLEDAA